MAHNATLRIFILDVFPGAGAPYSSPPLHLELFSFIPHAQAAPGPAETSVRCPGGGARPAAGLEVAARGPGAPRALVTSSPRRLSALRRGVGG